MLPVICPSVIILTPTLPLQLPHPQEKEKKTFKERSLGKGGQSTKRRGGEERRETRKGGMKYAAGEGRERRGRGREEQA